MMDDALVTVASAEVGVVLEALVDAHSYPEWMEIEPAFHLSGVTVTGQEPGHCQVGLASVQVMVDGQGVLKVTTTFWGYILSREVVE